MTPQQHEIAKQEEEIARECILLMAELRKIARYEAS